MPRYLNPHNRQVYLTGPDGSRTVIQPHQTVTLPDYYERYCNTKLIVRAGGYRPVETTPQTTLSRLRPARYRPVETTPIATPTTPITITSTTPSPTQPAAPKPPDRPVNNQPSTKIVGRLRHDDPAAILSKNVSLGYPISNNIGVGILSYNRPQSLKRLVDSIRKHTDLNRTTVFISDDNSAPASDHLLSSLESSGDIVVIRNRQQLGVAGNTNRLLRCLGRFRHALILNDDVEIISGGWDSFYPSAATSTGLKHFCFRQPGIYGAQLGQAIKVGAADLRVVYDKPHGAVLYLDTSLLSEIGYFDEAFGQYGMEHVDWSDRAGLIQGPGFYDVAGSERYFVIHNETSAVEDRVQKLLHTKTVYAARGHRVRHVPLTGRSVVPAITYLIPYRDFGRGDALGAVVGNIRGQRFPQIEIIVAEHDEVSRLSPGLMPITVVPVRPPVAAPGPPFNKSAAFNAAAAAASYPMVLHDADILTIGSYAADVAAALEGHDGCHLGRSVIYTTRDGMDAVVGNMAVDTATDCNQVVGYFEGGSLACRRSSYWLAGGFNEEFVGYGMEDCDFYSRLSMNCSWLEDRRFDFLHLWHPRPPAWQEEHQRNKEIGRRLNMSPMAARVADRHRALVLGGYGRLLSAAQEGRL